MAVVHCTGWRSHSARAPLAWCPAPLLSPDHPLTQPAPARRLPFGRKDLLRWLYAGRLVVATVVLGGAAVTWFAINVPSQGFVALGSLVLAGVVTAGSIWHTHVRERRPGETFFYVQVLLDVLLVTVVVHFTGGPESSLAPLYFLVIAEGALLIPLPGGILVGLLATTLYFADIFWLHEDAVQPRSAGIQIALFTVVATATGFLGDRLRRAGAALGEVETEFRRHRRDTGDILTNVSSGVLTVDAEGKLLYLNPAGQALLGLEAERWVGSSVVASLDEIAPGMGGLLRRSLEDGTPVRRYKTRGRRDGKAITLGVSTAVPGRDDDVPRTATAIFQDITESERMEALNRRTERLEAVAELSASLAHEIKNPLASIRSAVEQISRPGLEDEDRQTLERLVLTQSDRLSRLLSQFLEFGGLRMGRAEALDLAELVGDCAALVRQHPECAEGVRLRCEGMEEPVPIPGDADLLHRAVFNLMLNAVQFSAPEGRVSVRLEAGPEEIPREAGEIGDPVRLSIRDTGPGVPMDRVGRIFDPFYTTRSGGSGLGLSVVHRAVEVHDGVVLVNRPPQGGGAEFVVVLPGTPAEPEEVV